MVGRAEILPIKYSPEENCLLLTVFLKVRVSLRENAEVMGRPDAQTSPFLSAIIIFPKWGLFLRISARIALVALALWLLISGSCANTVSSCSASQVRLYCSDEML